MAALVIGAIGAGIGGAIGGTFLGMSAASIGWMVGSTLGGLLGQKSQSTEGPRIADLSVQASTYGSMVPLVRGSMRQAGNVIWSTPKREVATTEEIGGKGGPSVSQTTYSYNVDMAIALCEGVKSGVRRIWSNGKLIYDGSDTATAASVIASSIRAAAFRFYPGDDAQLPDPAIEAELGAGQAPAYRGTCYVVFEQMDCPNGQIPQLHFEVIEDGAVADRLLAVANAPASEVGAYSYVTFDEAGNALIWYENTGNVYAASVGGTFSLAGYAQYSNDVPAPYVPPLNFRVAYPVSGKAEVGRVVSFNGFANIWFQFLALPGGELLQFGPFDVAPGDDWGAPSQLAYDVITRARAIQAPGIDPHPRVITAGGGMRRYAAIPGGTSASTKFGVAMYDDVLYTLSLNAGTLVCCRHASTAAFDTISVYTGTVTDAAIHASALGVFVHVYDYTAGNGRLYRIDGASATLLTVAAGASSVGRTPALFMGENFALMGLHSGGVRLLQFGAIGSIGIPLADVVRDLCVRSGMTSGQVDVSLLAGAVHGYAITRQASARTALDPLMAAWFVDVCETDGVLRFTHRSGKTSVASIGHDDLGATTDSLQAGEAAPLDRTQEAELPRSITVTFINIAADYQAGSESVRRHTTRSISDQSSELPVAMESDHAAAVAQGLLYSAWLERNRRSVTLPRRWAAVNAGDVLLVEVNPGQWESSLVKSSNDDGSVVRLELAAADPQMLAAAGYGASPSSGQGTVVAVERSDLMVADIPLLREQDDDAGIYVAVSPMGPGGWPGAVLQAGPDVSHLAQQGAVTRGAVRGFAAGVLPSASTLVVDESSAVTVQLTSGALSGITREQLLAGGNNVALLGLELLAFREAQDLGDGAWRISGLLRGLRGTERHTGTHTVGESFVLVSGSGVLRVPLSTAQIGASQVLRAITFGHTAAQGRTVSAIPSGQSLLPLAPVWPRKSVSGGDMTITWDRRTRALQDFPAGGVDVPLFEASEAYEVDVFSDGAFGTVKRTISTGTASATYTAAQQVADFGSTQSTAHVRIHQVGAIGRGHHLEATL